MAAAFFAKLPPGRLTPAEADLRGLLLRTAAAAKQLLPPAVSLQEWVERRIPEEVMLGTDASGRVTLLPQARAEEKGVAPPTAKAAPASKVPPVDAPAFFRALPGDSFTPEEEQLRAAITACLSKGPLPVQQALKDAQVGMAARACLPRSVPLVEWVEKRVGGEVLVCDEPQGRVLRLAPTTKEERGDRREAFFASLPADSFAPEEERLRAAIFDFLATWKSKELANLSHVGGDKAVQQARAQLFPQDKGVNLREWIERRIGGEVELRMDQKGQYVVHLSPAAREDFFERLPADELLPVELDLRSALLAFLEGRGGSSVLSAAGQDRVIKRCRDALLPPGVSLNSWIERRIGGEVESSKAANNQITLSLPGRRRRKGAEEPPDDDARTAAERREAFFEQLSPDGFAPEEEALRAALLAFLAEWTSADPPTLSNAGSNPQVRDARAAFLPKGCGVSLKEWIDRRIGGEVETMNPDGKGMEVAIGLRGELDAAAAARALRKRKAEGGGKGHGGGAGKATKASGVIGMDPVQGPPWKKGR